MGGTVSDCRQRGKESSHTDTKMAVVLVEGDKVHRGTTSHFWDACFGDLDMQSGFGDISLNERGRARRVTMAVE